MTAADVSSPEGRNITTFCERSTCCDVLQVALPYLNSKLIALYERHRSAPTALPGLDAHNRQQQQQQQEEQESQQVQQPDEQGCPSNADRAAGHPSSLKDLRQRLRSQLITWLHAVSSGQWGRLLWDSLLAAFIKAPPPLLLRLAMQSASYKNIWPIPESCVRSATSTMLCSLAILLLLMVAELIRSMSALDLG